MSNIFQKSQILKGFEPYLLYFNLPPEIVKSNIQPKLLFPRSNHQNIADEFPTIDKVCAFFEKDDRVDIPNLIIMEVCDPQTSQKLIIGGYMSCGWVRSREDQEE